jgi:hypothetical protein
MISVLRGWFLNTLEVVVQSLLISALGHQLPHTLFKCLSLQKGLGLGAAGCVHGIKITCPPKRQGFFTTSDLCFELNLRGILSLNGIDQM